MLIFYSPSHSPCSSPQCGAFLAKLPHYYSSSLIIELTRQQEIVCFQVLFYPKMWTGFQEEIGNVSAASQASKYITQPWYWRHFRGQFGPAPSIQTNNQQTKQSTNKPNNQPTNQTNNHRTHDPIHKTQQPLNDLPNQPANDLCVKAMNVRHF